MDIKLAWTCLEGLRPSRRARACERLALRARVDTVEDENRLRASDDERERRGIGGEAVRGSSEKRRTGSTEMEGRRGGEEEMGGGTSGRVVEGTGFCEGRERSRVDDCLATENRDVVDSARSRERKDRGKERVGAERKPEVKKGEYGEADMQRTNRLRSLLYLGDLVPGNPDRSHLRSLRDRSRHVSRSDLQHVACHFIHSFPCSPPRSSSRYSKLRAQTTAPQAVLSPA